MAHQCKSSNWNNNKNTNLPQRFQNHTPPHSAHSVIQGLCPTKALGSFVTICHCGFENTRLDSCIQQTNFQSVIEQGQFPQKQDTDMSLVALGAQDDAYSFFTFIIKTFFTVLSNWVRPQFLSFHLCGDKTVMGNTSSDKRIFLISKKSLPHLHPGHRPKS